METAGGGSQPPADTEAERRREKEERILARRRRVEAKLEAKRRTEAGEEPQEVHDTQRTTCAHPALLFSQEVEEEVDEEKERVSWKQVEKSSLRLDKLSGDGSELVSNVVVAEDAREVQCRQQQEEARNARSANRLAKSLSETCREVHTCS